MKTQKKIIADRETGAYTGVSNILNISDGILGDCLGIQVIATFNTSRDKIDQALLRKGRLIAEYEFAQLSVEESNALLTHLGKQHTTTRPMLLTDIYNFDEKTYKSENKREIIGFKVA